MHPDPEANLPFIVDAGKEPVFGAPWQGQLFAITLHLSETGNFSWKEFVDVFSMMLKRKNKNSKSVSADNDYYACWLEALEELIVKKNLGNAKNLSFFKHEWEKAFLKTPHGDPVKI